MSETAFAKLDADFFQLYNQQAYAQALQLAQSNIPAFPEQRHRTMLYHWCICMAARLQNTEQALSFFHEALDQGCWFLPQWMYDDEDLESLQGIQEYEQMVAVCAQRLAEYQETVQPELLVFPPEGAAPQPYPLMLAMHGNNGNARDDLDRWRWLTSQGWLLAKPQSSQAGGFDSYVWNDRDLATAEVQKHAATLAQDYAINPEKVLVAGFSMGGGLAIWLAVSGAIKARGFVVLGPFLPNVTILTPFLESAQAAGLRGYIVVGEEDTACLGVSRKVAELLNAHNIPCELELRPRLAHNYPEDFQDSVEKALAFIL